MKEATGELNMTVVTVVAIAAVGAFFYAFVWPAIQRRLEANTICSTASPGFQQGDNETTEGYISCGALESKGGKGNTNNSKYTCTYFQNGKKGTVTCQYNDAVPTK